MTTNEPTGYENEPVERFIPLPPDLYCSFFDLEMGNQQDDCLYYTQLLGEHQCQRVLELGCGTGRIVEYLTSSGFSATGIDTSPEMLLYVRARRKSPVALMDMCQLGFKQVFDSVIIPHNTLNLLDGEKTITRCLNGIKQTLRKNGLLAVQLFSATETTKAQAHKRIFQFALFDTGDNGKLVKETIKTYHPESEKIMLEERYKLRSFDRRSLNRNYSQVLPLTVYSTSKWLEILQHSGYSVQSVHSGYNRELVDSGNDSTLLITARSL